MNADITHIQPPCFNNTVGVYFHIPFCIQYCSYCDFNRVLRKDFLGRNMENYHSAMLRELGDFFDAHAEIKSVDTLYFGGGTPSLYPAELTAGFITFLKKRGLMQDDAEATLEADPKTIRVRSLEKLKSSGITRLSIGAQSFSDNTLALLGRYHRKRDVLQIFNDAGEAGFGNISLDLIYGVPGQTRDSFREDIAMALKLTPCHISLYNLTLARGTDLFRKRKRLDFPSDELQIKFYRTAVRAFREAGIFAYEISNFARPGYESRHNLHCWEYRPYIGAGAGASSFYRGRRWKNISSPLKYTDKVLNGRSHVSESIRLGLKDMKQEYVMLNLRKTKGFASSEYSRIFHSGLKDDFPDLFSGEINTLIKAGKRIRLSANGINLSNEVFEKIF